MTILLVISNSFLALCIITSIVLGGLIAYWITSMTSIKKEKYNQVINQLNGSQIEVQSKSNELILRSNEIDNLRQKLSESQTSEHSKDLEFTRLHTLLISEQEVNVKQQKAIDGYSAELNSLKSLLAQHAATNEALHEKLNVQKDELKEIRDTSILQFKQLADQLLEEKSKTFAKQNELQIGQLLKPLSNDIAQFKQKVEDTYDKESKERFTLEAKIKELVSLNQQISNDATELANALKGNSKTQGDWGEMILENILEYSGLVKNREYVIQHSIDDDNGKKRPDVMVKYPDDRYIIIDSKVSLTAYERFSKSDQREEQQLHLSEHIRSMKTHIDQLSAKEYDKFTKTLDFVMMFVPVEPAYFVAMKEDPSLWEYAYKKRILLISPTNLIAALKMVSDIWKRENQNQNALEIARRGELLYDKFVGFVGEMQLIENHLNKASGAYQSAMGKLSRGKGNLVQQADKLRRLGLSPKKKLLISRDEEE